LCEYSLKNIELTLNPSLKKRGTLKMQGIRPFSLQEKGSGDEFRRQQIIFTQALYAGGLNKTNYLGLFQSSEGVPSGESFG